MTVSRCRGGCGVGWPYFVSCLFFRDIFVSVWVYEDVEVDVELDGLISCLVCFS